MGELKGLARFFVTLFCIIAACSLLSWFGWWLDGVMSKPAGHAGVIIQNNDPNNQITSQQNFLKLYTQIQGYENTIKTSTDSMDVGLAKQGCQQAVEEYDTMANGTTTKEWRPSDLPSNISLSDCN